DPVEEPTLGRGLTEELGAPVTIPPLDAIGLLLSGELTFKHSDPQVGVVSWISYDPDLSDDGLYGVGEEAGLGQLDLFNVLDGFPESRWTVHQRAAGWVNLAHRILPETMRTGRLGIREVVRYGAVLDRMRVADVEWAGHSSGPVTTALWKRIFNREYNEFLEEGAHLAGPISEQLQLQFLRGAVAAGEADPVLAISSLLAGSSSKAEPVWLLEPSPVPPQPADDAAPVTGLSVPAARHLAGLGTGEVPAGGDVPGLARNVFAWWAETLAGPLDPGESLSDSLKFKISGRVSDAVRAGRAANAAQLTAYFMERDGVYRQGLVRTVSGRGVVRDFTGLLQGPLDTDSSLVWVEDEGGRLAAWEPADTMWGPNSYVAVVDRGVTDRLRTMGRDHGVAVLIELILHDPALMTLIHDGIDDVVVLGSYMGAGDRTFQRALSAEVARLRLQVRWEDPPLRAYAPDGPVTVTRGSDAPRSVERIVLFDRRARGQQRTRWVPAQQTDAFPAGYDQITLKTKSGTEVPLREISFVPIIGHDGTTVAGVSNTMEAFSRPGEFTDASAYGDGWDAQQTYADQAETAEGDTYNRGVHYLPYTLSGRLDLHGNHTGLRFIDIRGNTHQLADLSLLRYRPELAHLTNARTAVLLVVSHTPLMAMPDLTELLLKDPLGVSIATELNTQVLAAHVPTGQSRSTPGQVVKFEANTSMPTSEWELAHPLPTAEQLRTLVDMEGGLWQVESADDWELTEEQGEREEGLTPEQVRMLRWIRALRYTLDQYDLGAFGDFASLSTYLPGIVAMEKLRLAETDPGARRPLVGSLLEDMLQRFETSHLQEDYEFSWPQVLQKMLTAAARHVAEGAGDGTLSGFLDLRDEERPGSPESESGPDDDIDLYNDEPATDSDDDDPDSMDVDDAGGVVFNSGVGGVVDSGGVDVDVEGVLEAVWGRSVGFAGGVFDRDRLVRRIILHTDDPAVKVKPEDVDALSSLVRDRVQASGEGLEQLDVERLEAAHLMVEGQPVRVVDWLRITPAIATTAASTVMPVPAPASGTAPTAGSVPAPALVAIALGDDALEGPRGQGWVNGAQALLSMLEPAIPSSPDMLKGLHGLVREVILHTSDPEAEVTSEHVTQLFSLAALAKKNSEQVLENKDSPAALAKKNSKWALENKDSLAAYHLILKAGIYNGTAETVSENNKSVILRQWQFPRVDRLDLNYISMLQPDGFFLPFESPWTDSEYYVLALTHNEQRKLTIGSFEVPVGVLLYVAEHDPKRRRETGIILVVPSAGENTQELMALNQRTGVRAWSPRDDGIRLVGGKRDGEFVCSLMNRHKGLKLRWVETGNPTGRVEKEPVCTVGVTAERSNVQVSDRVFTDVTGTVRFTVDAVVRRSVMSADGEHVIGVSTTPEADTPLVRGDALHGIDGADKLLVFDEASGGSISTPTRLTPGAVLVYASRGGNVLLRLRGDRDIELAREEAALLFSEIPELHNVKIRLRDEEFRKETALLLLNGNLPEEGESSHEDEPPSIALLISAALNVNLQYSKDEALIEIRERGKIHIRPSPRMASPLIEFTRPIGLYRFLGGKWESSEQLAEFVMAIRSIYLMRDTSVKRKAEFVSLNPNAFTIRLLDEYIKARPNLRKEPLHRLRTHLVEEVLAETMSNGTLQLDTFLGIPLMRGVEEIPVSRQSVEDGPDAPSRPVETGSLLTELVGTSLSNKALLDLSNVLQTVYRIIPPGYHRLDDPGQRLRDYLDRAWAHATAPNDRERTAENKPYRRIIQFISDAQKAGRAGSDAALTAYLLQRGGLFDRTPLLTTSAEKSVFRDFAHRSMGAPRFGTIQGFSLRHRAFERGPTGLAKKVRAPWGGGPYVVAAETVMDGLVVIEKGVHGWEVLAELVAHDPDRRAGADIVAVVPRLGANDRRFQRRVATLAQGLDRTGAGVTVWAHDGDVTVASDRNVSQLVTMIHRTGEYTRWIPATAADDFPAEWDGLRVRTVDGESVSVSDLVLTTALRGDGRDVLG
ncbi:hypothetical protein, partial [Streptomyces zaomyceticus]|uniref:hypothetical protein n=1 Tax=Streptomyces zaomyceticus TaxID=68286 RepID=UPI0036BBE954